MMKTKLTCPHAHGASVTTGLDPTGKTDQTPPSGGADLPAGTGRPALGFRPTLGAAPRCPTFAQLQTLAPAVPRLEILAERLQDPQSVRQAEGFIRQAAAMFADVSDVSPDAVHDADYESRPAFDKARQTWRRLLERQYDLDQPVRTKEASQGVALGCPVSGGMPMMGAKGILGKGVLNGFGRALKLRTLQKTFDDASDFVEPHDKLLHTNGGAVMYVRIPSTRTQHDYTGLFADAEPAVGVARYSGGATDANFVPGLGAKVFRDGQPSANLVTIHGPQGYDADERKDAFDRPQLTAVHDPEPAALKALNFVFSMSSNPNIRPVDQLSQSNRAGALAETPKAPFMLEIESVDPKMRFYDDAKLTAEQVAEESARPENDFRRKLAERIGPGTVLGEEWGRDSMTGERVHLATYVAVSDLVVSKTGDEELHFRHSRGEESLFTRTVQGLVSAYDAALDQFERD